MLEKNDKVFTRTPCHLEKMVNAQSTVKGEQHETVSALEQSPLAQSHPFKREKHSI